MSERHLQIIDPELVRNYMPYAHQIYRQVQDYLDMEIITQEEATAIYSEWITLDPTFDNLNIMYDPAQWEKETS